MKVRFPKFDFSSVRAHWAPNQEFAQRLNAMSLAPAYIEPYLLKVMMRAKPLIDPKDETLARELDIFIKQEMQHCRQHINFNKRLHALGYDFLIPLEKAFEDSYSRFLVTKSFRFHLAYSEGFEAMSATACELYFEDYNELLENADPEPTNLWRWHLAEEWEHRTICSAVYHELAKLDPVSRYFYRLYGYFFAMVHIGTLIAKATDAIFEHDRASMNPEELQASIARDNYAKKVISRRFLRTVLMVCSPFYDPAKRRKPHGYDAYLASFEVKYDGGSAAAVA